MLLGICRLNFQPAWNPPVFVPWWLWCRFFDYVTLSKSSSRCKMIQKRQLSDIFLNLSEGYSWSCHGRQQQAKFEHCKLRVLLRAVSPGPSTRKRLPQKAVEVFGPVWDSSPVETSSLMSRLQMGFQVLKKKKNPSFPQVSKSIEIFLTDLPHGWWRDLLNRTIKRRAPLWACAIDPPF